MNSILIIGDKGQVSQYLQSALSTDYSVFATSRESLDLANTESIQLSLMALFKKYSPNIIINPAAYTAVDLAEQEQDLAYKINADAVAEIGYFCAKNNIPIIHFSTDYVFDGSMKNAYKESDKPLPNSVYGQSKLDGERALLASNASAVILRTAWVYSNKGKNFYNTMLNLAKTRETLSVVNDQVGSPTYAGSIAEGVKKLVDLFNQQGKINANQQGIYNFTCDGQATWCDFAENIFELHGSQMLVQGISSSEYPTPAKRPQFSVLDSTKLERVFGFKLPNWKNALRRCVTETQSLKEKPLLTSSDSKLTT